MNKPSIIPRFGLNKVTAEAEDVSNLQLAATIFAFDVPLHPASPYDVQAGDGIKTARTIWHFEQRDVAGNSPKTITKHWFDEAWLKANSTNPLAVCKRAFDEYFKLLDAIKARRGYDFYSGAACRITNTRKAAVMVALGHRILGWLRNDVVTTWCFHEAAASDAALYDDPKLYGKLPDAAISYAKGAILGHEAMIAAAKEILTAKVTHRGRTAYIGRDLPKETLNLIDKLLYRK